MWFIWGNMPVTNFRMIPEYYEVVCPETGDVIVMEKAFYIIKPSFERVWRKEDDKEVWRWTKADLRRYAVQQRLERLRAYKNNKLFWLKTVFCWLVTILFMCFWSKK